MFSSLDGLLSPVRIYVPVRVYVCKYLCMYAGIFLCTQIRANFLHLFNLTLHTHEYIQTQYVCIIYTHPKKMLSVTRVEMNVQHKRMLIISPFRGAERARLSSIYTNNAS